MSVRSFRVSVSFDAEREQDVIAWLESLADSKKLGEILANMVRAAFDGDKNTFKGMNTSMLSPLRQQFFHGVECRLKEQDCKIDQIYSMCEDMYMLAKLNKAMGLESRTENLMLASFILQRQQSRLKQILCESSLKHTYESDKLLQEQEKAEKIFDYISEAYAAMLEELKPLLFRKTDIPVNGEIQTAAAAPAVGIPPSEEDDDDAVIELVEDPADAETTDNSVKINELDKDKEALFLAMMDDI